MDESPREKAAERQEMALAALRYDLSTARPLRELVKHSLETGARPEYIALRYGYLGATLDRVLAFKAAIDKQQEKQRERSESARGDREAPAIG